MEQTHLTQVESVVFRAIYELGEADIESIQKKVYDIHPWEYKTVLTIARNLMKKNVVKRERTGRKDIYSPTVDQQTVIKTVLERYLGGSLEDNASLLVDLLYDIKNLNEKDTVKLRELLDSA